MRGRTCLDQSFQKTTSAHTHCPKYIALPTAVPQRQVLARHDAGRYASSTNKASNTPATTKSVAARAVSTGTNEADLT